MWDKGPLRKCPAAFVSGTAAKNVRTEAKFEPADEAPPPASREGFPPRLFSRLYAQRIVAARDGGANGQATMPALCSSTDGLKRVIAAFFGDSGRNCLRRSHDWGAGE